MIVAGLLGAGSLLRFVPTAVMTGFVTAVGVNIMLGQLGNFTGYAASGANRVTRTLDLLLHPRPDRAVDPAVVGVVTLVGDRRPPAHQAAVARPRRGDRPVGRLLAAWPRLDPPVALVRDLADRPAGHYPPRAARGGRRRVPGRPGDVAGVRRPGAGRGRGRRGRRTPTAGRPTRRATSSGRVPATSSSGLFQGMPVGGSMSAFARSWSRPVPDPFVAARRGRRHGARRAPVVRTVVELVAMPALAALLIVVGVGAIKPSPGAPR